MKRAADRLRMILPALFLAFFLSGCQSASEQKQQGQPTTFTVISEVPAYSGQSYVEINGNQPEFTENEKTEESYESYSELDSLGRCRTAEACISTDLMPDEERGSIGQIRPSGWHTVKYEIVDGKYLYNRCHLIGYQLTAENANEKNLITGTRYMNTEGMLPFENQVAEYIRETKNHVMYRVTPIYEGENLVSSGVQMEAESVEDGGEGISFNVYVYNVQPGIEIDYATGESRETGGETESQSAENTENEKYILNKNTKKFHLPSCSSVDDIKMRNREEVSESREEVIARGYEPCSRCKP